MNAPARRANKSKKSATLDRRLARPDFDRTRYCLSVDAQPLDRPALPLRAQLQQLYDFGLKKIRILAGVSERNPTDPPLQSVERWRLRSAVVLGIVMGIFAYRFLPLRSEYGF